MGRKWALWVIVIFVVTLSSSLIINTPVRQLMQFIKLPDAIQIQGLNGTVTKVQVDALQVQGLTFQNISFKLQPGCFLRASICYQIVSDENDLFINIGVSLITQAVSIKQSQITLGSDIFQNNSQILIQPKGDFRLKVNSLVYTNTTVSDLVASVDWLGAGIQGEDQLLGNYQAIIETEAEKIAIKLSDTDSLLSLKGTIDINWDGKYKIDVELEGKPSLNRSVISALEMIAKRSDLNRFVIKKSGVLPPDRMKLLRLIHSEPN